MNIVKCRRLRHVTQGPQLFASWERGNGSPDDRDEQSTDGDTRRQYGPLMLGIHDLAALPQRTEVVFSLTEVTLSFQEKGGHAADKATRTPTYYLMRARSSRLMASEKAATPMTHK